MTDAKIFVVFGHVSFEYYVAIEKKKISLLIFFLSQTRMPLAGGKIYVQSK